MSKNRKSTGGGHICLIPYIKASLICTPLFACSQWNDRVNACETIEELNELGALRDE